jgi:hypothetical protein
VFLTEGTTNPGQQTEWRLTMYVDSVPGGMAPLFRTT